MKEIMETLKIQCGAIVTIGSNSLKRYAIFLKMKDSFVFGIKMYENFDKTN